MILCIHVNIPTEQSYCIAGSIMYWKQQMFQYMVGFLADAVLVSTIALAKLQGTQAEAL